MAGARNDQPAGHPADQPPDQPPDQIDPLYDAESLELSLTCHVCKGAWLSTVPVLVDWRDRTSVELLRSTAPTVECPSCGRPTPAPRTVVVLRPGDPVPVLFSVPKGEPTAVERLERLLTRYATNDDGIVPGPISSLDAELLPVVADRYTGFELFGAPDPAGALSAEQRLRPWLHAITEGVRGEATASIESFFNATDESAARATFRDSPPLQGGAWLPAIRSRLPELVAAQKSPDAKEALTSRFGLLVHLTAVGDEFPLSAPDVQAATDLLRELNDFNRESNHQRTELEHIIAVARELVNLTTSSFGSDHPLTLTALNDAGALMLDQVGHETEARELLGLARSVAAHARQRVLADITSNLGIGMVRADRVPDADDLEAAVDVLNDALHLHKVLEPDRPERRLSVTVNLAALIRSSLTRSDVLNTRDALELLGQLDLFASTNVLSAQDAVTQLANELNTRFTDFGLSPSAEKLAVLLSSIDSIEEHLDHLQAGHSVRVRTLTNMGSIAVDLCRTIDHSSLDLVPRAKGWLESAVAETEDLPEGDARRVLARMTLAALLFMHSESDDSERAVQLLEECAAGIETTSSSRLHHTVSTNLAQVHLARGEEADALRVLGRAAHHARNLIARAQRPATRLGHVAAAGDTFQRLAFLHARARDARAVIHAIEDTRGYWLSNNAKTGDDLDHIVERALEPGTGILYAGTCGLGTYGVILTGASGAGAFAWTPNTAALQPVLAVLADPDDQVAVANALDKAGSLLGPGLLETILRVTQNAGLRQLEVIAGGPLTALPLAFLGTPGHRLADHLHIRYRTSIQRESQVSAHSPADPVNLAASTSGPTRDEPATVVPGTGGGPDEGDLNTATGETPSGTTSPPATALAIIDPTNDLPLAWAELSALKTYAADTRVPSPDQGIKGWLLTELPGATHLHMACHAEADPHEPFNSHFSLGPNLSLTVEELSTVDARSLRLVVATSCQSGVVDQRAADAQVGLGSALIAAGAAGVIEALWDLDDLGTSVVVARMYADLSKGEPPHQALASAQSWTAEATTADILQAVREAAWLPVELQDELRALCLHPDLRDPQARPFNNPARWSALRYIS